MKRHSFLITILTGWLTSLPVKMFAQQSSDPNGKGFKVPAGKDRFDKPLSPFKGDEFFCKVSGSDNNGSMYVFESTRVGEGGPLLHTHYDQDEFWYILEGNFLIKVGEVTHDAKAGDFVYGPRKVPHTFSKVGSAKGRIMIGFNPAGKMEEFFKKLSDGTTKGFTDEQREAMRREHGFETSGPAITVEKKYTH